MFFVMDIVDCNNIIARFCDDGIFPKLRPCLKNYALILWTPTCLFTKLWLKPIENGEDRLCFPGVQQNGGCWFEVVANFGNTFFINWIRMVRLLTMLKFLVNGRERSKTRPHFLWGYQGILYPLWWNSSSNCMRHVFLQFVFKLEWCLEAGKFV